MRQNALNTRLFREKLRDFRANMPF